ncbi:MAG: ribosome small subunit-dependent GTPase A [Bdellovibrionales bacterium RIFCSPHIGHO2_01_FULL_40_29]|nr:MAG: ribosome small subunit-dependent GTPase A [Bdellovibrionales bacterium RIFCSPHIGHO2_01_FULL_40_29]OFZ33775.1 MAG: ribosome small subunit-dependent GTPase A [Bdellovibrionales bacterium RIFCSPHIGHO2_02_FULL_40_15]
MLSSEKEFLFLFGWDDFFESQIPDLVSSSLFPARVICEERNLYRLQAGLNQIFWASVSGKMQFNAVSRVDYPAVGDWVMVEFPSQSDRGVIHQVLERKTIIHRKQVGSSADMQILSTNVDYAFITTSVNTDLNYRRIERYLAVARDAGSVPVILLTKADACLEDIDDVRADVQKEFPGVEIHALSKNDFEKAEFLAEYLKIGTTSIFIGSSGVGKSTLVNFLIGNEQIKTQDVRESDGKGRHTTTSRNLYVSRYGGLIIDTPGMRELQLSDHADGVRTQFSDIEDLIQSCRFSDCKHQTEPGCAIKEAIADGSLADDRWRSYQKLEAEVRHGMRKQDKVLAAEDRKIWKKRSIEAKKIGRSKKGIIKSW